MNRSLNELLRFGNILNDHLPSYLESDEEMHSNQVNARESNCSESALSASQQ